MAGRRGRDRAGGLVCGLHNPATRQSGDVPGCVPGRQRDAEPQPNPYHGGSCPGVIDFVRFRPTPPRGSRRETRPCHRPVRSTSRPPSTIRVASASWWTSRVAGRTRSCATRSPSSSTSSTAARRGSEANTGDGAGILIGIPHRFLGAVAADAGIDLPERGYGVAMVFLPRDDGEPRRRRSSRFERELAGEGLRLLGWRDVPTDPDRPRPHRPREPAGHRPGVHRPPRRPRPRPRRGPRLRAPPVRRPPPHREGHRPQRAPGPRRRLHPVDVLPDDRLQGDAQRLASC